ncbi:MAG: ABC transporter transmembrane domain-containing protein, partial [Bacteroidota bacterium]
VKSFTNEGYETNRYKKIISEIRKFAYRYGTIRGAFFTFIITCLFGGIIFVIWSLFLLKIEGEIDSYSLGKFLMISMFVVASIGGLPEQIASVQRALGATERVFELMNLKGEEIKIEAEKKKI